MASSCLIDIARFVQTSAYKQAYNAQRVQPKLAMSFIDIAKVYIEKSPTEDIGRGAKEWDMIGNVLGYISPHASRNGTFLGHFWGISGVSVYTNDALNCLAMAMRRSWATERISALSHS